MKVLGARDTDRDAERQADPLVCVVRQCAQLALVQTGGWAHCLSGWVFGSFGRFEKGYDCTWRSRIPAAVKITSLR